MPQKKLFVIILCFFAIFAAISIATFPTKSQDAYWSLLLVKGWVVDTLNPYLTSPDMLRGDSWFAPYLNHTDQAMTYGPLWVHISAAAVWLGRSLITSLLLIKFFLLAILFLAGWLLSRIMALHNFAPESKNKILLLAAWNPLTLQLLLMDAHNDTLILLSILGSYFFFKKEQYAWSASMLIFGSLVKYTPLFLLPIPLFYLLFRNHASFSSKTVKITGVATMGIALAWAAYLPFGGIFTALGSGPASEILTRGATETSLFPTMALGTTFGLGVPEMRLTGVLIGLCLLSWYISKNKPLFAYTFPLLAVFLFGTPWFLPWYSFWILPLLILIWPSSAIIATSLFLTLIPSPLSPLQASYFFVTLFLLWKLFTPKPSPPAPELRIVGGA